MAESSGFALVWGHAQETIQAHLALSKSLAVCRFINGMWRVKRDGKAA
jgi:hypothetical protein